MKKNLVLQKFPCFGQCQEYKISSYDDGILILEGKNNVEKKGVYFTQINAVQLSSLKNKAASIKWIDYKNLLEKMPVGVFIHENGTILFGKVFAVLGYFHDYLLLKN